MNKIMDSKVKISRISRIFAQYCKAKKVIELKKQGYTYLLEESLDGNYYNKQESLINYIDEIYSMLSINSKIIIDKEYIKKDTNSYWWEKYYSRSTYYRQRIKAINEFLEIYSI
ncbi:MAG: hypothetical protein WC123_02520 [Bacilli bacterium]|nr:hypothetical protein [Bacilli bacterium]